MSEKYIKNFNFSYSNFKINFIGIIKILYRHVWGMSLFQNFPSFLVKPFIFAVNIVLIAKNGDKVDPLEMFTSETVTFYGSTLFAFFTLKMRVTAKMNGFTRKLVKFWTRDMPQTCLSINFNVPMKLILKFEEEKGIFSMYFFIIPNILNIFEYFSINIILSQIWF